MSELKAFRIIQGDTGGYGAPSYKCDADGNRIEEWSDACEVYDKSEADKVIAHNKYKRCLATALWCRIHDEFTQLESERPGISQHTIFLEYRRKAMWWNKWRKRWLELAEKFKEEN